MNERIFELAEQAGFQYIKDEGIGWAGNYNSSLPKFAKLIIGECVDVCDQYGMPDGTSFAAMIIAARIKEKFGIEE